MAITKTALTISSLWAANHPKLFAQRVEEFKAEYSGWNISVRIERKFYIEYTATPKKEAL